jgi:PDDEXK-like domain of unknown function (DUF3799)
MLTIPAAAGTAWAKTRIIKPGIYSDMPLESYHSPRICDGMSLSSTALRTIFIKSPAHYWCHSPYNSHRITEPVPRHFAVGRAMHHLAMGQDAFDLEFVVPPEYTQDIKGTPQPWNLKTKHAKEWVAQQKKTWITHEEIQQILGMANSLARDTFVINSGLLRGFVERSVFWQDVETGIWLKIRPDVIPSDQGGEMVDLKTAKSVQWTDMEQAIERHGYDQQFGLMREVLGQLGMPFTAGVLVFVEKTPPYCVRTVELSTAAIDIGVLKNRAALRQFALCWNRGHWPGPGRDRQDAEIMHPFDNTLKRAQQKIAILKEEEDYELHRNRNAFIVIQ